MDYPGLIAAKASIIEEQDELRNLLDMIMDSKNPRAVPLRSEQYVAVGCDLSKVDQLDQILRAELPLENCKILVVAEVSITYMDLTAADAVISYAAGLGDGKRAIVLPLLLILTTTQYVSACSSRYYQQDLPILSQSRCKVISRNSILL